MKKRFVKIIAMLLAASFLASCSMVFSAKLPVNTSLSKMLGFDRADTPYSSDLTEVKQLYYSTYIENGSETILASPITIDIKLPENWVDLGNNIFQTWNEKNKCTVLCMKAPNIYKIPPTFVLDGTTHATLNTTGIRADLSGWKTCSYKTGSGYESIIYYDYDENVGKFSTYSYIKINDDYVLGINMQDNTEFRGQMIDILDSITTGEYNPVENYYETDLRGYMNYLVNYFHEPYKTGDDVSDINVMYLCFLYAYANRASYYNIGYDLENQTISIPQSRMEEICTSLLGDQVNITDFEQKYLYENGNGSGKYGGVDGVGYIVQYATDYWMGDHWYLDHEKYDDPLEITENGDNTTVKAHIYYGMIGEYTTPRTLEYVFEKVAVEDQLNSGHIYYKLIEIKE